MEEAERISGRPFPEPPRPPVAGPLLPAGTLGELLSGLRVLGPQDRIADNLTRIEIALARLERAIAALPPGRLGE